MILEFSDFYRFLSNFYPTPIEMDGLQFRSVEHAFQAAKTLDIQERFHVAVASTPGEARRRGRHVRLRPGWNNERCAVMKGLLRQKFKPGSVLAGMLLQTGDQKLCEGNTWGDTYWGVCNGKGENHLGRLLMEIREELKCSQS